MTGNKSHYFDPEPLSESNRKELFCRYSSVDFTFVTDSGVFSKTKTDYGTNLMLETFISERKSGGAPGIKVMDLGCGYGLVGIVIKRLFPECDIAMADINSRAVELSVLNANNNSVKYANIRVSDGFSAFDEVFDIVLTNPPVRAGKQTVFKFYEEAYEHINDNGILYVVIQKKQGAPTSANKLQELFGNCITVNKSSGYRVLKCMKARSK